jgi:hypothetical protein
VDKRPWNPYTSVIVVGVANNHITDNVSDVQEFPDLPTAQAVFPDLDPCANGKRFTWAIGDPCKEKMRFETWHVSEMLAI